MNKTEFVGSSADKTLRDEAIKGVNAQYDPEKREAATQMVEKELAIVKDQGTAPQYLILLNALKETGAKSEEFCIRGTAASSILVHVLGFSRVDPLTVEPRLYSEFFFDITGSKFTPFELNVTTDLHERIRKYFENYPGEERITPKYDHDKLIGFYLGDPLTDSYTGEPFYPYYINFIPVEDPNGFGENLLSGDIYDAITPKDLPEYIKCLEFKLDIDAWEENAETLFKEGKAPLNDLIADREDVYEYMLDHGVEKEMAFRIAEHVRKGKALSKGWNQDMIDAMNKVSIPEWYRKSCEKIRYLFPRAHAMSFIDCYCKDVVQIIAGRTYKVDLVFYHRILKCFVLVDLKRGEVQYEDIGQMNFYLNYYREEMNTDGDTEPIGIVLGAYQDKLVMQYALQNITNQVFVSRYQLYLPEREQLEAEFRRFMDGADAKQDDNSKSSDTV